MDLHIFSQSTNTRKLFYLQFDVTKTQNAFKAIRQFIRKEIRKHRETYDENNIRDLVDLYIQAEKKDFQDNEGMDGIYNFLKVINIHFNLKLLKERM